MTRSSGLLTTTYTTGPIGEITGRKWIRRTIRLIAVGGTVIMAAMAIPGPSSWGSPKSATTSPLTLTSDYTGTNPNSPPWCLTEDDYDERTYSGSLNGTYTMSEQLCGLSTDYYNGVYWNAGGIGLESDVYVVGQLSDVSITAPDGTSHHAILMGQSTSKGTTTYHYATCYVPPYSVSSDTGGTPLIGGTWQIALSGQVTKATWYVNTLMTTVSYQQSYCPTSEQNLTP